MTNKILWMFLIFSIVIIGVLAWLLIATPVQAPTIPNGSTTENGTGTPSPSGTYDPNAPLNQRVFVTSPEPGTTVGKTFQVKGEAPGNWYFEASFPVKVIDPQGNTLANSYGQAQSEWMTTDQVPFIAEVKIEKAYTGPATVIIMKDNPSGLPEHDDSIDFQIVIK